MRSHEISGTIIPNIATMLTQNVRDYPDKIIFSWKSEDGKYSGITWKLFYEDVLNIAWNLHRSGMKAGSKIVLFSPNSLNMLKAELAIMASGGIAVPVFAYFKKTTAELLINHSDAEFLIIDGQQQFNELKDGLSLKKIWSFNPLENILPGTIHDFNELLQVRTVPEFALCTDANPETICLNMYTSGTMGTPKCVQLSHRNILSQQAAIKSILKVDSGDRFLSYLPWHHSFGGIFELFCALSNAATYHLESSYGKDARSIFENWKIVRPTVFFSVPKVYQSLVEYSKESRESEDILFNSGLKFVFTAAAALPQRLSDEFESRGIPVIEGWGLTETAPCCTLTDPAKKRESGLVGFPIPGVEIRIAKDGEIFVRGPNVMISYYKNDEANAEAFTEDGWYKTGDVGEISENGLKLVSRKDRIFKLSNGEKVIPAELEKFIELKCHYVLYAVVSGNGEEYPVALIFPNKKLFNHPDYSVTPDEGCFCPRSISELGKCLSWCMHLANQAIGQKFAKIKAAAIIGDELSVDNNTLTHSMKVAPRNVVERYRAQILSLYGENVPMDEEVYIIKLDSEKTQRNGCIN